MCFRASAPIHFSLQLSFQRDVVFLCFSAAFCSFLTGSYVKSKLSMVGNWAMGIHFRHQGGVLLCVCIDLTISDKTFFDHFTNQTRREGGRKTDGQKGNTGTRLLNADYSTVRYFIASDFFQIFQLMAPKYFKRNGDPVSMGSCCWKGKRLSMLSYARFTWVMCVCVLLP